MIKLSIRDIIDILDLEEEIDIFSKTLRDKYQGLILDYHFDDRHNTLVVSRIIVPKDKRNQGIGKDVMTNLMNFAKSKGLKTVLTPTPEYGSNKERLNKFYRDFGFKKNKDMAISETMIASGHKVQAGWDGSGFVLGDGTVFESGAEHNEYTGEAMDACETKVVEREMKNAGLTQDDLMFATQFHGYSSEDELVIRVNESDIEEVKFAIDAIEKWSGEKIINSFGILTTGDVRAYLSNESGESTYEQWLHAAKINTIYASRIKHASSERTQGNFWLSPDGEIFDSYGEHDDSIFKISPDVYKKYWEDRRSGKTGFSPRDVAKSIGWTRFSAQGHSSLLIDLGIGKTVEWVLSILPIEMTLVHTMYVDKGDNIGSTFEISVLEGESVLEAWKRRNDIRHRTFASIKISARDTTKKFSDKFMSWFSGSKIVDSQGQPLEIYHGTNAKFKKFNLENAAQNVIWFTTNRQGIESREVGAAGHGYIVHMYAKITNPSGWDEYEKFTLDELQQKGYDGVIFPENDHISGFAFYPEQLKIIKSVEVKGE